MWATRHIERRLLRLVLTVRNPEKISNVQVKNKAAVNAPWLYRMYSPHCVTAIGVSLHQWQLWAQSGCWYIHIAWGFSLVVRFICTGHSQEPLTLKRVSNSAGLHAFFLSLHYLS